MGRLDRLREEVANAGIIPRREGKTGLPTEVYYLKVKELAELVANPALADEMIKRARIRSKKRRRKKYIKDKAMTQQFGKDSGYTARIERLFREAFVTCLGTFTAGDYFISETGFGRAKSGYVFQIGDRRVVVTQGEAKQVQLSLGVVLKNTAYDGEDLQQLLNVSEDRIYRGLIFGD